MLLAPFLRRWSYTRVAEQVMDCQFAWVSKVLLRTLYSHCQWIPATEV